MNLIQENPIPSVDQIKSIFFPLKMQKMKVISGV